VRPTIEFINFASDIYPDAELVDTVEALKVQVTPGLLAGLEYEREPRVVIPSTQKPSAFSWWMGIFKDSDQAGALGVSRLLRQFSAAREGVC
jgi:hypothetical protein